jgi:hypothetical protein
MISRPRLAQHHAPTEESAELGSDRRQNESSSRTKHGSSEASSPTMLDQVEGRWEELVGRIQEKYGIARLCGVPSPGPEGR